MSEMIAVVGQSGSGKSTSLRNLDPKTTVIINVAGKSLPFRGFRKNYKPLTKNAEGVYEGNLYNTSDVTKIATVLKLVNKTRPEVKTVVIEDAQYLMAFEAMDRCQEKSYDKFTQIAANFYSVLKEAMNMRDDLTVCVLTHSENTGDQLNPSWKIKTVGKMIDNMITVEGLFTYVLFTRIDTDTEDQSVHQFITRSDGTTTAKTPMGCFEEKYVDNDLEMVIKRINEYNNED